MPPLVLTPEQWAVLITVLKDPSFQNLIGAEEWSLSEDAEGTLWEIIAKAEKVT